MPRQQPLISVVTPCLNAAAFIRDAINSVANVDGVAIEHIIVDGGSTDGTRKILQQYEHLVIINGSDDGPYDALNKGFERSTGEILAWLNADDFYLPQTLDTVGEIFDSFVEIDWLTTACPIFADSRGRLAGATQVSAYSPHRARHPDSTRFTVAVHTALQQESTFWRRGLWERCGARIDTRYKYAADFELWLRFWQRSEVYAASVPLGCFRWSADQRSKKYEAQYRTEVDDILKAYGTRRAGALRTLGRRASLLLRGLPQSALKYCPFATEQKTVSYNRVSEQWEIDNRFSIPA